MKRLGLALALLVAVVAPARAYVCPNGLPAPWGQPTWSCQWEPQAGSNTDYPSVQTCQAGGPGWGIAYFYSEVNYGGLCAAAVVTEPQGSPVWGYALHGPYNFVMRNGWLQFQPATVQIRSMKLGGSASWGGLYTAIWLSAGPDATANPDNWFHCSMSNWGPTPAAYPDLHATCSPGVDSLYMLAQ